MGVEVKRQRMDMLNGPIWNKIPQYALPVAATAILEQLFNASDLAVVGNFTGDLKTVAVAAVGANSALINLIVSLFIGIALGANVVIANAVGRRDEQAVHETVHTSMVFAVLGGILIALFGQLVAAPVMRMLLVPDDVFPYALLYLRIYLIGMPVILLFNFEAAIFRSIGETKIPLIALASSGVLNVVLNLFFVAILHMTVEGVAIATVLSNAVSAAILLVRLLRTDKIIRVELKMLSIHKKSLQTVLRIGLPAGLQSAVFALANMVIQSAINSLGTIMMAASSAAFNLEAISANIFNAYGQACSTFVGQNFGAGKIDRCKKTLKLGLLEGAITLALNGLLMLAVGRQILALFNNDPRVVDLGYYRIIIIIGTHFLCLMYDEMSAYMRGFGISFAPAVVTMVGICGIRLFWTYVVFPKSPTLYTLMLAYPVSLVGTVLMVFATLMYYRPSKRFAEVFRQKAKEV